MNFNLKKTKEADSELDIELDKSDLDFYVKEALKTMRNSAKVNGYRSGKVPDEVLVKNIGEEAIREEALNLAVQRTISKVVLSEKLDVLEYLGVNIQKNTPQEFKFTAKLILYPEVELGVYKNIEVKAKPIDVTEEEINKTIEEVRSMRTVFEDKQDPAQSGDRLEVDFEVKDKGTIIEGGKSENHPVVIGKGGFVPGFEESLIGLKVGEEKKFSLEMPKDYYQKSVAGKVLDFEVKIKKIQSSQLPEVTNEFVKQIGNFQSVDDLKKNIKDGILQEKKTKEMDRIRLAIVDAILDKTKVSIPSVLIERQMDSMVSNFDKELHERGMEMGLYLAHIGKKQEDLRNSFKSQAEKQIKTELVLREIGKNEGIVVTEQEIEERLTELNAAINVQDQLAERNLSIDELKRRIGQTLFTDKIFELLLTKNSVKEI